MHCPVCDIPLIVVERLKVELDYCIACKGFWFDSGELQLLMEALGLTMSAVDPSSLPLSEIREKDRKCPVCSKKMDKVLFDPGKNVILDRCYDGHGLWFDRGELGRVLDNQSLLIEGDKMAVTSFLGEVFNPGAGKSE